MSQDHESCPAFPNPPDAFNPGVSTRLWVATQLLAGLIPRVTDDPTDADFKKARFTALQQADLIIEECNL